MSALLESNIDIDLLIKFKRFILLILLVLSTHILHSQCLPGSIDSDADGICDIEDMDDDNDGIADENETYCSSVLLSSLTFNNLGIENIQDNKIELTNFGGWRTSYSAETYSLPISLEFSANHYTTKMIGLLPEGGAQTATNWNDDAYKMYLVSWGRLYGKVPGAWDFNTPSTNNDKIVLNIDINGTLTVTLNNNIVYTGTAPIADYHLAISSVRGGEFDNIALHYGQQTCTIREIDTDSDGIPNRLDLDSDGDMCVDAYEGEAEFKLSDMDAIGRLIGGVEQNSGSLAYGIPLVADTGQLVGDSRYLNNPTIETRECLCIASNNPIDSDNDGLCDVVDPCPNLATGQIGTACNDGDSNTVNDVWLSDCTCLGSIPCNPGDLDSDADGICDKQDKDDDNDGIADIDESKCGISLTDIDFNGNGIISIAEDSIVLSDNTAWRSSYSNDIFTLPIHIEFNTDFSNLKMIGFIPTQGEENLNSWVDGSYKLYMHTNGYLYGKLPTAWNFVNTSQSQFVSMDIDGEGNVSVIVDGNEAYTGKAPVSDYRLVVSSYSGSSITDLSIRHSNNACIQLDKDTDNDGQANRLDLDSDNDNCVDAFEGDANVGLTDMDAIGRIIGGVNQNSVSASYGIPTLVNAGQQPGGSIKVYEVVPDLRECLCIASNNPTDSDGDGICDSADLCSNISDALIGTVCNDGDNCTTNDTWRADCECRGELSDSDGDGICDADDPCVNFDNNIDVDDDNIPDCQDPCIDIDENGVCDNQQGNVVISELEVYTSHRRGIYDNAFNQHIFSNDPNALIYYTLDGSIPSSSSTLYTGTPINISASTILRTFAISGGNNSNIETHSFIFTDDVVSNPGLNDYITDHPLWGAKLKEALISIPSISIISDSILNPETNVAGSMEMLYVDKKDNFQANCGIGEYGNASINLPKRNMRLYFDEIYGPKNLKEPVFKGFENGIEASEKHDKLDLRSSHESWLWNSGSPWQEGETYITTKLMDDIMLRGGSPNPHNRFVHVYLDGKYWGQYDLREKFDDNMMQEYQGGDNSDYNFISGSKVTVSAFYPIFGVMKDSINTDWQTVIASSNDYLTWKTMVDENSFFDLMIQFMYGFAEAEWNATGAHSNGKEFIFQINDADLFFSRGMPLYTNRTYPQHNANGPGNMFLNLYNEAHPDFIQDFADRAAYLLEYNGALTTTTMSNHMDELAEMIECSIIGEAAKWSEESGENPDQWRQKIDSFKINMVNVRTDVTIDQMQNTGIYPKLDPVQFSIPEGLVAINTQLSLINPNNSGSIYYTLDGTDPRAQGGAISATALSYQNPINIPVGVTQVNARIKGQETKYPETNIAVNKPISVSLINTTRIPELANDGAIWGVIDSNTVAYVAGASGGNPWIEIDLLTTENIDKVRFWDRSEASLSLDANNPHVFISDLPFASDDINVLSADPSVQTFIYPGIMADLFEMTVNTTGRYVRIQYPNISGFYCSEFEIIQQDTSNPIVTDIWSAMVPQFYHTAQNFGDLVINEIHYNPKDSIYFNPSINAMDTVSGRNFEFIELKNEGSMPLHLYGTQFNGGVRYQVDSLIIIQPNSFIVIAEDAYWFQQKFGFAPDGRYSGKLDNGGETIVFSDPFQNLIDSVNYDDNLPWDPIPDQGEFSLAYIPGSTNNNNPSNWKTQIEFTTPRAENIFCDNTLTYTETIVPINCNGANNGFIVGLVSGGVAPYTYQWSNGATQNFINGLPAGTYTLTLTDDFGCTFINDYVITEPPALQLSEVHADESIAGDNDGVINLAVSGGVPPYSYNWSNGSTNQDINNLPAGTYTVQVTDTNNCTETLSITIQPGIVVCSVPNSISASNIQNTSATLLWSNDTNTNSYEVQYRQQGFNSWTTFNSNFAFAILNNLTSCTTYEVRIKGNCAAAQTSSYSPIYSFETVGCIAPCAAITGLFSQNVTTSSAFLVWDIVPNATYTMYYRVVGNNNWFSYPTQFPIAILFTIPSCTDFEWYVEVNCPNGQLSNPSPIANFTTVGAACKNSNENITVENIIRNDELLLYPNPTKDILNISFNFNTSENAIINIYNINGQIVFNNAIDKNSKLQSIDVSHLPAGQYHLVYLVNNQSINRAFIIE